MHLRIQTTGKFNKMEWMALLLLAPHATLYDIYIYFLSELTRRFIDTTTALEALEKGFSDLMDLCDVVTEKFTDARDQFNEENSNRMQS